MSFRQGCPPESLRKEREFIPFGFPFFKESFSAFLCFVSHIIKHGTIANFVARKARKVVGIEYVPEAIEDAKVNSALNGIDNTLFYAGDMKDILTNDFIAEHGRPDVIITDPPRAGMHNDVIDVILAVAIRLSSPLK